jgi:hypothetical protein
MNRSEYQANQDLQRNVPAWQKPGKGHKAERKGNSYWGALFIGAIISIPFLVEIFKNA